MVTADGAPRRCAEARRILDEVSRRSRQGASWDTRCVGGGGCGVGMHPRRRSRPAEPAVPARHLSISLTSSRMRRARRSTSRARRRHHHAGGPR